VNCAHCESNIQVCNLEGFIAPRLTRLSLRGCGRLSDRALLSLALCKRLQSLDVSRSPSTVNCPSILLDSFASLPFLTSLHLRETPAPRSGVRGLVSPLATLSSAARLPLQVAVCAHDRLRSALTPRGTRSNLKCDCHVRCSARTPYGQTYTSRASSAIQCPESALSGRNGRSQVALQPSPRCVRAPIRRLSFRGCAVIGDSSLAGVAHLHATLTSLSLSGCVGLRGSGFSALAALSALQELDLSEYANPLFTIDRS
jgi:hypothetical protein